jgi:hypothetical protein
VNTTLESIPFPEAEGQENTDQAVEAEVVNLTEVVEAVEADTAEAVNTTDIVVPVFTSEELAEAQERLDNLTTEALAAINAGKASFVTASEILLVIREERLVENTTELSFAEYCEAKFGITRDYADKYIRAGRVYQRITTDLPASQRKDLPLPTTEGQIRPLAKLLKSEPKDKLIGKVWKSAVAGAKTRKKGVVINPSQDDVTKAVDKVAPPKAKPVNGSTKAGTPKAEKPVEGTFPKDSPEAKILALHKSYDEVPLGTFLDILLDGVKLGEKWSTAILKDAATEVRP